MCVPVPAFHLHFAQATFEGAAMKVPNGKEFVELLKDTYTEWNEDKAPRLGAALSYYTIFSMAPLLAVIMGIVGIFYSDGSTLMHNQLRQVLTPDAAGAVEDILKNASQHKTGGIVATVMGTATLLMGAGGFFGQLQDALNTIWEVQPKPGQGIMSTIKNRFLSFSMVLGSGFILLISLAVNTFISVLGKAMGDVLPVPEFVLQGINFLLAFALVTGLFAMIYKVLPDVEIGWHDVWIGAAVTSFLFGVGKFALGLYLGKSSVGSPYGAAGSLAVLLIWIYYAAQILFFGAEFTQVYAKKFGSKIVPSPNAEAMTAEARAQQGMTPGSDGPLPESASAVAIVHPHGVGAKPQPAWQRDFEFLWPAAVGFLGVLFLAKRKKSL
jgi:membrane protein